MPEIHLIVLDPGHFHAALLQKDTYPGLSPHVSVYAPLGPELLDYLTRIAQFNARAQSPTAWELNIQTGPDFLDRMVREHPGNAVILTGRNRPKIDRIEACLAAGLHVLADKPWIIRSADLPRLAAVLDRAEQQRTVAFDIMTERWEITSILQRELVNDQAVFGKLILGSPTEPAVSAKSVHHIMKVVSGTPVRRPVWFFDTSEYGEGLSDVGTHVVDLVQWTAFPTEILDYRTDIAVLDGRHWPTAVALAEFERVTGEPRFPPALAPHVRNSHLDYFCNNSVHYTVKGSHIQLEILWNWEAPPGSGDVYEAAFRGTRATIDLRQDQLYVLPSAPKADVLAALNRKLAQLHALYPGLALEDTPRGFHIQIPDRYRVTHEDHFAQVANRFFGYLKAPATLPAWEKSNMLVKYFISTRGVELANVGPTSANLTSPVPK